MAAEAGSGSGSGSGYQLPSPSDQRENKRLDLQHELFLLTLEGNLHRAPIEKDIKEVLDIGTGSGIWAIGKSNTSSWQGKVV
jgi:ubiquinone/menaquinone biosynthesis C-methylase UbiE